MYARLLTTSAMLVLFAGPAFADCSQEIQSLKQATIEAKTGASTSGTGMPATEHQQEVLAGKQQGEATSATGQSTAPETPHQQQVLGNKQEGGSEKGVTDLISQAREMAQSGDEKGCMQKVAQAKDMLGIE